MLRNEKLLFVGTVTLCCETFAYLLFQFVNSILMQSYVPWLVGIVLWVLSVSITFISILEYARISRARKYARIVGYHWLSGIMLDEMSNSMFVQMKVLQQTLIVPNDQDMQNLKSEISNKILPSNPVFYKLRVSIDNATNQTFVIVLPASMENTFNFGHGNLLYANDVWEVPQYAVMVIRRVQVKCEELPVFVCVGSHYHWYTQFNASEAKNE